MQSVEKTGKTVDAAVFSALEELGATIDEVIVEVIDEGDNGILGIGRKPARVLVSLDRMTDSPVFETNDDDDEDSQYSYDEKEINAADFSDPGMFDNEDIEAEAVPVEAENTTYFGDGSDYLDDDFEEQRLLMTDFLSEILAAMDVDAKIVCSPKEGGIQVDIDGDDVGVLIGRRGDTLAALQYLSSLVINRNSEQRVHLSLDVSGYKKRRENSLIDLAQRTAGRVMKVKKEYVMEAMPAAERRIIHSALQSHRGVKTISEGNEPHRYVVVVPLKDGEVKEDFERA